MQESDVFDQLVKELDREERRSLLVRIQSSAPVYTESLSPDREESAAFDAEEELAALNLFQRLLLLLKSLFSRKNRFTLLRERYLRNLALRIERQNPDLLDFTAACFKESLYQELKSLRGHAHSLHRPLQEALEEKSRQFIAFLARDDLKDFQERLLADTDPEAIWEAGLAGREAEVRTLMLRRFDKLAASVTESAKQRTAQDALALFSLLALSRHPFEALLEPFGRSQADEELVAGDFQSLSRPLKALAATLERIRIPPSARALYDLFFFLHGERLEEKDFDLEEQLGQDMSAFHSALAGIRAFRERVPLLSLLRIASGEAGYYPEPRGALADWFSLYLDFWRQKVQDRYLHFHLTRRRARLLESSLAFFSTGALPELGNYRTDKFGPGTPVKHSFSLTFLKGFIEAVFTPAARALKLIYINGEFYKEENRHSYTDAFLFLAGLSAGIAELEDRLGPQGDLRAAIQEVKNQPLGQRLRAKRILDILVRADTQACNLVDAAIEQLANLKALLYGILKGQPGDRYDTLVNLKRIGGSENRSLRSSWSQALEGCEQAATLLGQIRDLEIGSSAAEL